MPSTTEQTGRKWYNSRFIPNPVTLLLILILVFVQNSEAAWRPVSQAPGDVRISYQGRLDDNQNQPLTGVYDLSFGFYTASTGGTPFWTEIHANTGVRDGLFSLQLGSIAPIPLPLPTGNLYLGVSVDGTELLPRQFLSSSIHAIESDLAMTVLDGSIGSPQLADNAVTGSKIMNGAVGAADLATGVVSTAKLADGSVTLAKLAADARASALPVGTVIAWWRASSATPLPSDEYAVADGSVVDDVSSPLHGQTLPDLTDRFIMGVAPDAIGVIGGQNSVDLSHSHTVDSHRHQVASHTHSLPSHTHPVSGVTGEVYDVWDGGYYNLEGDMKRFADLVYPNWSSAWYYRHNHNISFTSGAWSGASGGATPYTNYESPGTNSKLSSTTENRPAYVGLVYLIRIK